MGTPPAATRLRAIEYYIDTFMESAEDCVRWHYTKEGWRQDVVAGQMDIAVLTTEAEHKLSIVRWLGYQACEARPVAYSVRDLSEGPIIGWACDPIVEYTDQLQYRRVADFKLITAPNADERLASFAQLLPYGVPSAEDILEKPWLDIHAQPALTDRLLAAQAYMLSLTPELFE